MQKILRIIGRIAAILFGGVLSSCCGFFLYFVMRYGDQAFGTNEIKVPIFGLTLFALFGVVGGVRLICMGILGKESL